MSREAVNKIIDRAVTDDSYFEELRNYPERAIQGFDLDPAEASAFKSGAYNVVVRATRKDREAEAALRAKRAADAAAATATPRSEPPLIGSPSPPPPKAPVAGLVGFFIGILVIGGGIGGFRYFESQWPWQALGFGKAASPANIPAPSLGARPKPSVTARSAPASASAPGRSAAPAPSSAGSGQAQLRPTPAPSSAASSSPSAAVKAQQAAVEKAYYQAVGTRLANVDKSFRGMVTDLRVGNDPTKNVADLSGAVADLGQHLNDAPPPDQLKRQHDTLVQAVPLMQSGVDQLKTALGQKNNVRADLVAAEIGSLMQQLPDELSFATQPHPEIYQPIDSSQQLTHILNFDVLSQNVTARNNAPAAVVLRIGMQSGNPTPDEISDTLRHSIMAARQSFPQAGQVRVTAFKEANGAVGSQVGSADWYCSPDAKAPDAGSSTNWQDSCSKVYLSMPGANGSSNTTTVPY